MGFRLSKAQWRYAALSLGLMLLANRLVYDGARLLTRDLYHWDLSLPVDALFPQVSWTLAIYLGCFLWWPLVYFRMVEREGAETERFFAAKLTAYLVCFLTFLLFPTRFARPEALGEGLWDRALALFYQVDGPDNLFPSIHCLLAWICWVGVRGKKVYSPAYRLATLLMALAVCASTLTTRQHVVADALGGVALAELSYLFCGGLPRRLYAALVKRLLALLPGGDRD